MIIIPKIVAITLNIEKKKLGGYWTEPDENGDTMFYGTVFNDLPLYRLERAKIRELTQIYSIPEEFNPASGYNKKRLGYYKKILYINVLK